MKVRYIKETEPYIFTKGKIYDVLEVDGSWYRIMDDSGEDYMFHKKLFEVVEE